MEKQNDKALCERVHSLMLKLKLRNETTFAKSIGITPQTFNKQLSVGSVSSQVLIGIAQEYPQVSMEWLMRGTGSAFTQENKSESETLSALTQTIVTLQQIINQQKEEIKTLKTTK